MASPETLAQSHRRSREGGNLAVLNLLTHEEGRFANRPYTFFKGLHRGKLPIEQVWRLASGPVPAARSGGAR